MLKFFNIDIPYLNFPFIKQENLLTCGYVMRYTKCVYLDVDIYYISCLTIMFMNFQCKHFLFHNFNISGLILFSIFQGSNFGGRSKISKINNDTLSEFKKFGSIGNFNVLYSKYCQKVVHGTI